MKELLKGILSAERSNAVAHDYPITSGEVGKINESLVHKKVIKDSIAYVEFEPENPKRSKKVIRGAAYERFGKLYVVYPVSGTTLPWQAIYLLNQLEKPLPRVVSTYVSQAVAADSWITGKTDVPDSIEQDVDNVNSEQSAKAETDVESMGGLFEMVPTEETDVKKENTVKPLVAAVNPEQVIVKPDVLDDRPNPLEDEPIIKKYLKGWSKERVEQLIKVRRANAKLFIDQASMISNPNDPKWVWFDGTEHLEDGFIAYLGNKALGLESPPGCGKEMFLKTMSFLLFQPITFIRCNGGTTEAQLEGSPSLTVQDGLTVTGFDEGLAITRLRAGHIVVLDEVNAIDPAYTFIFHDVANGSRVITSSAARKEIRIHSKAWLCVTMNKGTRGSYELNEAFTDRMSWLILSRPDKLSAIIKAEVKGCSKADLEFLDDFYKQLKEAIKADQLSDTVISVRGMVDVAFRLSQGQSRLKAVTIGLINKLRMTNKRQADALTIIAERECAPVEEAERYAV